MNKKNILLTALFAISAMQIVLPAELDQSTTGLFKPKTWGTGVAGITCGPTTPAESDQSDKQPSVKGWNALCKTYATSLISGGLIGTATGLLSSLASIETVRMLDKIYTSDHQ